MHNLPNEGFVTLDRIVGRTGVLGISRATFYAGIAAGAFPKPVKIGTRAVWPVGVIRDLIARIEAGELQGRSLQPRPRV